MAQQELDRVAARQQGSSMVLDNLDDDVRALAASHQQQAAEEQVCRNKKIQDFAHIFAFAEGGGSFAKNVNGPSSWLGILMCIFVLFLYERKKK